MTLSAQSIIEKLHLIPHPKEGGYYFETYRSHEKLSEEAFPDRYGQSKVFSTAIYYLLTQDTFSHFHRLQSDEIFHFYYGDTVEMVQLFPDGSGKILELGNDLEANALPQVIVPQGTWQGSKLKDGGKVALLGATVSPGFDFSDYEHGKQDKLIEQYPEYHEYIIQLTK